MKRSRNIISTFARIQEKWKTVHGYLITRELCFELNDNTPTQFISRGYLLQPMINMEADGILIPFHGHGGQVEQLGKSYRFCLVEARGQFAFQIIVCHGHIHTPRLHIHVHKIDKIKKLVLGS
jgi:hypothetical protein